jgi:hypothetical protein
MVSVAPKITLPNRVTALAAVIFAVAVTVAAIAAVVIIVPAALIAVCVEASVVAMCHICSCCCYLIICKHNARWHHASLLKARVFCSSSVSKTHQLTPGILGKSQEIFHLLTNTHKYTFFGKFKKVMQSSQPLGITRL